MTRKSPHASLTRAGASLDCPPEPVSAGESADVRGVRSEGQRLLLEISVSLAKVAAAVGCASRQTVGDWKNGAKSPGAAMRRKLSEVYGIPEVAWSQVPAGGAPAEPRAQRVRPAPDDEPPAGGTPTTMAGVLKLLEMSRERMEDAALLEAERAKWAAEFSRALALKARLEKEAELLEDRIVREHPMWKRVKRALTRALVPFPAAARAVAAALKELDA